MALPLIPILRTISSLIVSEMIPINKGDIIKGVGDNNVIDEASIVSKAKTRSLKFGTRFFIPRAR